MAKTKIVLIGAGSTSFGVSTLADLYLQAEHLHGSTIALCDIDEAKLSSMARLARLMNSASGEPYLVECACDFRDLLAGARFVVVSVEADRLDRWRLDWQIPLKHGIRHVLGENGGPGGLSHALRTISLVLGIGREVERLAPDAYLITMTNPLSRVCLALTRYTRLKVVGLCHQINKGYYVVGHVLGLTPRLDGYFPPAAVASALRAQFHLHAAGLNHLSWIMDMRERGSERNLYAEFRTRLREVEPRFEPLSRRLCDAFGLFPASGDDHVGEYFGYAWETSDLAGYDFAGRERHSADLEARVARATRDGEALGDFLNWESGERAAHVIAAIAAGPSEYEESVNVLNNGALPDLPDWAVVEVPAVVGGSGVAPVQMPALPPAITALLNQQVAIQDRVVEAAVHGDRCAALQALLLDPVVTSYAAAEQVLDDLLATHAQYLPEFARTRGRGDAPA